MKSDHREVSVVSTPAVRFQLLHPLHSSTPNISRNIHSGSFEQSAYISHVTSILENGSVGLRINRVLTGVVLARCVGVSWIVFWYHGAKMLTGRTMRGQKEDCNRLKLQ